ncbi:MAG: hypothetical protein AB7I37_12295 [Pirellulales bacterium]
MPMELRPGMVEGLMRIVEQGTDRQAIRAASNLLAMDEANLWAEEAWRCG